MDNTYFVVGGDARVRKMMDTLGFSEANSVKKAKTIVFTGGEDVCPVLYRETPLNVTSYNWDRDKYEIDIWKQLTPKQNKIGICRGGQFLNVMNGGSLWQDVDNHTKYHPLSVSMYSEIKLEKIHRIKEVTSTHHQMMRPGAEGNVVAFAKQSTTFLSSDHEVQTNVFYDPEVIWYKETNTLCFQPHPEYNHEPTFKFFKALLESLKWKAGE